MAPKRSAPVEDPPSAASSSEEEETAGEEEEELEKSAGAEEEDEEDFAEARKPLPSPPSKHTPPGKSQKEETESDSGTNSEFERLKSVSKAKPILSKPVKAAVTSGKRGAGGDGKEPKRAKKEKESESNRVEKSSSEDVKKQPFQRIWSEEDEVAVLEGLIKFGGNKWVDAIKYIASFHQSIKKDLHIDVSFTQLKDKMFSLKRKFDKNRKGMFGEGKTFNKEHDQKIFDLSKRIWGSEVAPEASVKSNGMAKAKEKANVSCSGTKVESKNFTEMNFDRSSGMEEYVIRKGSELMLGAKKAEMKEKLNQLHLEELELFLKRNELVREYTKLVLASYENKMDEDA